MGGCGDGDASGADDTVPDAHNEQDSLGIADAMEAAADSGTAVAGRPQSPLEVHPDADCTAAEVGGYATPEVRSSQKLLLS